MMENAGTEPISSGTHSAQQDPDAPGAELRRILLLHLRSE